MGVVVDFSILKREEDEVSSIFPACGAAELKDNKNSTPHLVEGRKKKRS